MNRRDRLVVASLETDDGFRCVDIVMTPGGLYFWDEWRRDPEDPSGWHTAGRQSVGQFDTQEDARRDAAGCIEWLSAG
tara:strand:+ start:5087 stop:5320 length:234 start_codon:yes stop_codon:yes gene_type:complete